MKNHQYIRQLRVKELAQMLIHERQVIDYDEDIDGEFYPCGSHAEYILPNGTVAEDYDDALWYTVNWLNADYKEGAVEIAR